MEIKKDVFFIGCTDWNVRDFHGYNTGRGSSYNAYLVKAEKTAIIDSVKAPFCADFFNNIEKYSTLDQIDYVVCNHSEPDHSGAIPALMATASQAELVCNAKCKDLLSMHYNTEGWKWKIIKDGETLDLGGRTLAFATTPMAHWPDSMVTYLAEEKLLFSNDAFGQHFASSGFFDDEVDFPTLMQEAKTYYANIIMLYGASVQRALAKAATLDIEMIAPSHGIIWRKNLGAILDAYQRWSTHQAKKKAIIFYDSMWKSTDMMAQSIYEGALEASNGEVEIKLFDLKSSNITEIACEVLEVKAMAVGSPTLNKSLMPKVAEVLTYLKGLSPEGKTGFAFGSYGWAKKGGQHAVSEQLESMKVELLCEPVQAQYVPTESVLEACREAGKLLAESAKTA